MVFDRLYLRLLEAEVERLRDALRDIIMDKCYCECHNKERCAHVIAEDTLGITYAELCERNRAAQSQEEVDGSDNYANH